MINRLLSKSDHEQRHHEKLKTIMHTSANDQIDSDIIFYDPYVDNNSGQAKHDTNAHDQPFHDFESLIQNVQIEDENQRKMNIELKRQKMLLQRELETYSLQIIHMLGNKPNKVYDPHLKIGLGYENPERLKKAIKAQSKMYDGKKLESNKLKVNLPDYEETLEDTEKNKLKTVEKGKNVNTEFEKFATLGKLLCVTPLKNKDLKAKMVSKVEVKMDKSKPLTSCVESSNSVRRPKSKDTKSKNSVCRITHDSKSSNAHIGKMSTGDPTRPLDFRFGNDHFAAITRYGDYVQGNLTICHGDDLLIGSRDSNLYTISIFEMRHLPPVCLISKATSTKSWLWNCRLSHLNFSTINQLTSKDLVDGLPNFKYNKDHICSACEHGKSKKASLPPKLVPSTESKLKLLYMDCYSESSIGFRNYNRRTKKIMEMIHVKFDELTTMASECNNPEPEINCMNFQDSSEDTHWALKKTWHRYAVSSLMDTAYWSSE
ncbi:retrovirus-related pol polyprotein from transposon TNT 1-94 [Tanacetum coccineum]